MSLNTRSNSLPVRSPLFQAIAIGLIASAVSFTAYAQSGGSKAATASRTLCDNVTLGRDGECQRPLLLNFDTDDQPSGASAAATAWASPNAYTEQGIVGKPDTWLTNEFKQDWGLAAINAQYAYARGLTGQGQLLGVADSGTALAHTEFAGKQHQSLTIGDKLADGTRCANFNTFGTKACYASKGDKAQIEYVRFHDSVPQRIRDIINNGNFIKPGSLYGSHGTHVGGTIAANRDGSGMHGVAFGSNLAVAKIFADSLREWRLDTDGFYRVLAIPGTSLGPSLSAYADMYSQMGAMGVRAINHSWSFNPEQFYSAARMDLYYAAPGWRGIFETLRDGTTKNGGMIQVWAAGNIRTAPPPGQTPMASLNATLPRLFPELEPYWLSVANLTRTGTTTNPSYVISSSSMICGASKNWCISAPGTGISSSVLGGDADIQASLINNPDGSIKFDITGQKPTYIYQDYTGTSMATPHVVGALGLLFERYPYLSNVQVRDVMLTTATDLGAPGVDDIYGWGMLNLQKAIEGYGQFRVDTNVVMNQKAGGAHVWNDARVWDDWTNHISGPGRLTFNSAVGGWLRLSGTNTFNGLTVKGGVLELTGQNKLASNVAVDGGLLLVNGNGVLENTVTIGAAGALGGTGTIKGNASVFGTMAPGASIGTLTINGNYVQEAGSRFIVEMQPPSATDKLVVNGAVTLNGGTVVASRLPGVFGLGQSYNFLTASNGITGTFAGVDNRAMGIFLQMALRYGANSVYADVVRAAALASIANTSNQRSTAGALDGLADSNSLLQALVLVPTATQANDAFDLLSGEAHGSARSVIVEDSRHSRDTALARARTGHDAFLAQSVGPGFSAWAQVLTHGGQLHGDGNSSPARFNGRQWLVGADYQFDGGWRIGALGGVGNLDVALPSRRSEADIDSRMIGIHGGQRWGGFGLHAGYIHTAHELDLSRKVVFANYSDSLHSRYDATSGQAFVEAGYQLGGAQWQIEPYLQQTRVTVDTEGFVEQGGAAALSSTGGDSAVDMTTGGVRFSINLKGSQQTQTWLSLRGMIGHRKASGDLYGDQDMRFAGSNAYTVSGAALASDATLGEIGIAARISERTLLEVGYTGQSANEGNDHGANARITVKF